MDIFLISMVTYILTSFLLLLSLLTPIQALASNMGDSQYLIQKNSVYLGSPSPTPQTYPGPQFVLPTATPIPASTYTITLPKRSENKSDFFGISMDSDFVDFGPLAPTDPIIRKASLSVTPGKSFGYGILIFEDAPPHSQKGDTIPDTSCDQGSCSESIAARWENVLSFGFGYRCESNDIFCTDFIENDSFKRFSKNSSLMSGILGNGSSEQQTFLGLSYRLNISASQPREEYINSVTVLLLPNY